VSQRPTRLRRPVAVASLLLATCAVASSAPAGAQRTASQGPAPTFSAGAFARPPASVRPGTRWWWDTLGGTSTFDLNDALEEVNAFADAGFGRFEIAWAANDYGTPSQQGNLDAVAKRAAARGLQLDMTLGPGWPWAAPTTTGDLGVQELQYGKQDLTGPSRFQGAVPNPIDADAPQGKLRAVTAARVVQRGDAGAAVQVPKLALGGTQAQNPPETSTILDPRSLVDLTKKVRNGALTWDVPKGDWILFSFWQRAQEGTRVSLIDDKSVKAGLKYVEQNQLGRAEPSVRKVGYSFFEDSLELHANELFWTSSFQAEFAKRRGYDMTKYLPLLYVQTVSDYWVPETEPVPDFELPTSEGARYRHDFYETLTDLYVDNHLEVVAKWAKKYGMSFRTQAGYGNNMDTIRSAREGARAGVLVDDESLNAGDTPFLVRQDTLFDGAYDDPSDPWWRFPLDHYRQVTSGAAQAGKLEVTTELGAWFGRELQTFLRDYKRMMDKEWAAGVTRPLLHGYTHSPESAPWPGNSHFTGVVGEAVNFRTWPEWQHLRSLSDYWARGALVLQQGAARTDVAVLRDSFVTTAAGPTLSPKAYWTAENLEKAGYTLGYVDSRGVSERPFGKRGDLFPAGPSYDAVVVDGAQFYVGSGRIPADTAEALLAGSKRGLRVVFVGTLPSRGLDGKNPSAEDKAVKRAVAALLAMPGTAHVKTQADVAGALRKLGVRAASEWSKPVHVLSQLRETKDASFYYLWNATDEPLAFDASLMGRGVPSELDLWNGSITPVATHQVKADRVTVPVRLAPHGTTVLMLDKRAKVRPHAVSTTADAVRYAGKGLEVQDAQGGPQRVALDDGRSLTVSLPKVADAPITVGSPVAGGPWQLQVTTYGPEGLVKRPAAPMPVLADWRTLPGLATESGIGTYRTNVTLPASWVGSSRGVKLDLGAFDGSVQVYVNATRATADLDPQAPVDITSLLRPGTNTIKVVLATTPMNKAAVSPTTQLTRAAWAATVAHGTQAYGLQSEVRLLPYARGVVPLAATTSAAGAAPLPDVPPALPLGLAATALVLGLVRSGRSGRLQPA
jgi:hypothetical protein